MKKNSYNVIEIDIIFKNCYSHKEIFEACKVFKQLQLDGLLSAKNYKVAAQFSVVRFKELTQT